MKYVYPALFTKEVDGYSVAFPNIVGCYTDADDLSTAMERAADALCLMLYDMEESGCAIPVASNLKDIQTAENEFVTFITCDTLEYRKFFDNKAVKKTVSIPSWLSLRAEKENISLSQTLQDALKRQLGL